MILAGKSGRFLTGAVRKDTCYTLLARAKRKHSLSQPNEIKQTPLPVVRSIVGGVLMGLANLVPGVSGGTMILVTGLYDEFITAIADVTRFRITKRNLLFLAIVGGTAGVAIVALAGTLSRVVTLHRSAMFSLFIGLTLGGAPMLARMIKRFNASSAVGLAIGIAVMIGIALSQTEPVDREAIRAAVAEGRFVVTPNYPRDVASGVLGISAMVLPGISGAYMLLVLDRYETILAAIAEAKRFVFSPQDRSASTSFLHVIIPTAIGAVFSLVLLSNLLKWALRRHEKPMLGFLLGILLGSVVGIWPFDAASSVQDYGVGAMLALLGFVSTTSLARLSA